MLIPGMDGIPEDPSVPVTGSLHGIGKDVFMFPFPEPAALRVSRAASAGPAPVTTGIPAGWWVIAVFISQRPFTMAFPVQCDLLLQPVLIP